MYTCPICFYNNLDFNPLLKNYDICPSCGTEFGNDDEQFTYDQLRRVWIDGGCKWWNKDESKIL